MRGILIWECKKKTPMKSRTIRSAASSRGKKTTRPLTSDWKSTSRFLHGNAAALRLLLLFGGVLTAAVTAFAQSNYEPYIFTTLAGKPGYGNADGAGSAARFYRPRATVSDSAGNVYVVDSGNNTIRKITPAGVVSHLRWFAGGCWKQRWRG